MCVRVCERGDLGWRGVHEGRPGGYGILRGGRKGLMKGGMRKEQEIRMTELGGPKNRG